MICWVFGILVDLCWVLGVTAGFDERRALPSLPPPANCSGSHGGGSGGPGPGRGGLAGGAEFRLHLSGRRRGRHRAVHHPHRRHPHRRSAPRQRLGPLSAMATGARPTHPTQTPQRTGKAHSDEIGSMGCHGKPKSHPQGCCCHGIGSAPLVLPWLPLAPPTWMLLPWG